MEIISFMLGCLCCLTLFTTIGIIILWVKNAQLSKALTDHKSSTRFEFDNVYSRINENEKNCNYQFNDVFDKFSNLKHKKDLLTD